MSSLSANLKFTLILLMCIFISVFTSACDKKDENTIPYESPTKALEFSPSDESEVIDTPITSGESIISVIDNQDSVPNTEAVVRYVKGNSVNFRDGAGLDSNIILRLNSGSSVEVVENEGTWSRVVYNDIIGFIHNDYLSDTVVVQETEAVASITERNMPDRLSSPSIKVKKSERILELWDGDTLFASYSIGLGWEPEGDKKREGDGRTPEGTYYVCTRNSNSRFYLSLGVSYPNAEDAKEALDNGNINRSTHDQIVNAINNKACPPWNTPLGGEIMIHGMGSASDWTAGCVAVDNDVMDILWKYCPLKTPITIEP